MAEERLDRRAFVGAAVGSGALLAGLAPAEAQQPSQIDVSQLGKTPHTRFACNLEMWWRKLPFLERIKNAASFGYPAIEFWPWQGKDLDAIAQLTQELGIEVAQFTAASGFNRPEALDGFVKAIQEACQVARKLRAKKACVVPGANVPGMTERQMHDQCILALKKVVPLLEQNDLMLIVEPLNIRRDHKGQCLYRSEDAIRICREVGSKHVKINWDLYHQQITEGDLCGHLREGISEIGYVQFADHPGRHEPGTGEINYNRVLKEVYDLGYRGYVGMELVPKTTELAAAVAVAKADQW
ncbi:MAG: hydroxypyruvate isomerase family protein [Thermoguttaceae bacterium]